MNKKINPKDFLSIKVFTTTEDLIIKGGCKQKKRQKVKGGTTIIRQQVKVKDCDCEI